MSWFKYLIRYLFPEEDKDYVSSRDRALNTLKRAEKNLDTYKKMYTEQLDMADQLRAERRKNHFSELFTHVPVRGDNDHDELR